MNIEAGSNAEQCSDLEQLVDEAFILSSSSHERNAFFNQQINEFFTYIHETYPGLSVVAVPALEKLRGGSEEAVFISTELRLRIETDVRRFLTKAMKQMIRI